MEIFTNTDFIYKGLQYPPLLSSERLSGYSKNLERYKGEYNEGKFVYVKDKLTGQRLKYPIITENYFKLLTQKLEGLLLSEKPVVSCGDYTSTLSSLLVESNFWAVVKQGYRNYSSLGDCVFYVSKSLEGRPMVNITNPKGWFKVVSSTNIDEVLCHVLVQPIFEQNYASVTVPTVTHIRVLYHYRGYYIEKFFKLSNNIIGEPVDYIWQGKKVKASGRKVKTGLTDFAVFSVSNNRAVDEIYGQSDYDLTLSALVERREVSHTLISAITERNISPILQLPKGSTRQNSKTGAVIFPGAEGGFVEVDKDAKDIKFVGLDAPIDEVIRYCDSLLSELSIHSQLGMSFLSGEYSGNPSGEALKTLLKSPLDKISSVIDDFDVVLKKILCQMMILLGITDIAPNDISIIWQDGLSESGSVTASVISQRVSSGTMSKKRAMVQFDGISEEEAEKELVQINNENEGGGGSV